MGQLESFGSNEETALRHIGALIAEIQPDTMVQSFVLLIIGSDGEDRWLSTFVAPGQKQWESLGMLQWAVAAETNEVGRDEGI